MPDRAPVLLVDTVTLSNFALLERFDLLLTRYGMRLVLTSEVLEEIAEGVLAGYGALPVIEAAVDEGSVTLAAALRSVADRRAFRELLRVLGPGEASCIVHAAACGGVLASDDQTARQSCAARGIAVTGTIGILKACVLDEALSAEDADLLLCAMVDAGFYSPVGSISGLL